MTDHAMDIQLEQLLKANHDRAWDARIAREAQSAERMARFDRLCWGICLVAAVMAVISTIAIVAG